MQKGKRFNWLLLVLVVSLLVLGLKISGIGEHLAWTLPSAQATDKSVNGNDFTCTRKTQSPSFNENIVIGKGEVACGNVTSFGGSVIIQGELHGNVTAFNSNTFVIGQVFGNLTLFGGSVSLNNTSQIHGHITVYGSKELNAQSKQLDGVINGYEQHLVVLIALILTIPVALILALGLFAAWILGTIAISWTIGEYIVLSVAPKYNTRLIDIVVGLTALVLVGSIPYIGWLISIGVGVLGIGAVFLSRFGTRLYSQPKKPLTI
jgi:hypothetical protein